MMKKREMRLRRWLALAVILVLGMSAAVLLLPVGHSSAQSSVNYTVAQVTRGNIVRSISAAGQLLPLASVEVSSQISGLVTEVHVDFNSPVRKGQLLARIDPSTFEQTFRQRRADLEAARASHKLAELNTQRLEGLIADGIATQQEFDQSRAQLQQAKSGLLASEAALENARVDLQRCSITSPIDGTVIFKQIDVGTTVISSLNAPTLLTISPDLTRMKIIARISEVDIAEVRVGQDVTFTVDSIPDRTFPGKIVQIRNPYTPSSQKQQSTTESPVAGFDASIELDNHDLLLRPGLSANISVVIEQKVAVLQVPNAALRFNPGNAGSVSALVEPESDTATIYRMPNGDRNAQPVRVPVRLGTTGSFVTEVIDGLKEGDVIVTGIAPEPYQEPRRSLFGLRS
jgi:HlyD family secretion protein